MCCNQTFSRKFMLGLAALGLLMGLGRFAVTHASADDQDAKQPEVPAVLNFEVKSIKGEQTHLSKYYGDVVLIVNTASKCGLTPQYKQLQKLHDDHREAGLSILGFPANNFGKQEPGSNEQIVEFCQENYGVEFDMFSKISVKGEDQAPLYAFLTSDKTNPGFSGDIRWNFDKFLISREGKVIARFDPRTSPDAKQVIEAIQAALKQPVPDNVDAVRAAHKPKADKDAE